MKVSHLCCALVVASASLSCVTLTTVTVAQKTTLERQLMGDLEPLTEEELLAASVRARADTGMGRGSLDDLQQQAISARRRQLFNRDDILEQKAAGCLGEGPKASVARRKCDTGRAAEIAARLTRLVEQENEDRRAILQWLLAVDPVLTQADRPKLVQMYTELLQQQLRPGDWSLDSSGNWTR